LGADVAGVEAIKNLVLPGAGRIAIVDKENITNRDLGLNFFVT